jgi:hypothetical protein
MKKKSILIMLLILSIALVIVGCNESTENEEEKNIDKITSFEECVKAGNPVMESYPRQCTDGTNTFTEEIKMKACTKEYNPVCGYIQIQCVTQPCEPIRTTFPNLCEAENANAQNITAGECKEKKDELNLKNECESFNGNWLEESKECTGINKTQCEELDGYFNECASACRNDPDAEICTMQCVIVCQFN